MRTLGKAFSGLLIALAAASTALAQEKVMTIAGLDDGSDKIVGGSVVADETGRRYVVKDEFFGELMGELGAVKVSAEVGPDGKTLDVKWASATVKERIDLKGGGSIAKGTTLKVVGRRDHSIPEAEEVERFWKVILPSGKRVTLPAESEFSIDLELENGPIGSDRVEGVVALTGSKVLLDRLNGSKIELVGKSASVARRAAGKWIEGYGLSYTAAGTFEIITLEGAAKGKKTRITRTASPTAKGLELDAYEGLQLVNDEKPGFFTVRYNFPGIGSTAGVSRGYVPESDAEVGARFFEATGKLSKKKIDGDDRLVFTAGSESFVLGYNQRTFSDSELEKLVGKTLKVSASVDIKSFHHGELSIRAIEAVTTKDLKAEGLGTIKAGTAIRIVDGRLQAISDTYDYQVRLASGAVGWIRGAPASAFKLEKPSTTGLVGTLTTSNP